MNPTDAILTPDEEHARVRAEVRRLSGPYTDRRLSDRRDRSRTARLHAAADAGYDTWEDYRGER